MSIWIKDQLLEQALRRLGIPFDTETVEVAKIDFDEGLKRQSRLLGKLNDDYVLRLAVQMGEPDAKFKMGLLQKPPSKSALLWPWSANHRYGAFRLVFPEAKTIEAYTCTVRDPLLMDVISTATNCIESEIGFSREERIIKARFWIEKHNMAVADAARIVGVKPEAIYAERAAADTKKVLEEIGVQVNGMSRMILRRLAVLRNRNVLRATANTLQTFGIKGREAESMIADVARAHTESQQIGEVGRWESIFEKRVSPRSRPGRPKSTGIKFQTVIRDRTIRHITGLEKVALKNDTLAKLQLLDPADIEVVRRSAKVVVPWLIKLLDIK